MTTLADVASIERRAVQAAIGLSAMRSAFVARATDAGPLAVTAADGPLAERLCGWRSEHLTVMSAWVRAGTSSHFPGGDDVPAAYQFPVDAGVRSISVHPLIAGGQQTGILSVADTQPTRRDPSVVEALELLAAQTATSVATAGAFEDLHRRAAQDPLTGLGNAAAFAADLRKALAATEGWRPLACLMIDVDRFKQVNDTRGHPAGDRLLRGLAASLGAALRDTDGLYRIGAMSSPRSPR